MERRIDELLIKMSGKVPVDRKLAIGQEVRLVIHGAVVQQRIDDNQDGGVNITYVCKATAVGFED